MNTAIVFCVRVAFCLLMVFAGTFEVLAQQGDPCQCPVTCPAPGYTKCHEGWTSHNTVILTVPLPRVGPTAFCQIEVHYCCRNRPVNNPWCQKFVTGNISASCEVAITCMRIPKECVADLVLAGQPITDAVLRKQIYQGVLKQMMCGGFCDKGLPAPGQLPYEWVFSIPACIDYIKTGGPMTAFCLQSCGNKYCVYAFRMITGPGGGPKSLEKVVTEWVDANSAACRQDPQCIYDACDENFDPACADWE